jgi:hypothetical protein
MIKSKGGSKYEWTSDQKRTFDHGGSFGAGAAFAGISGFQLKAEAKGGLTEKWPWPYKL